MTFRYPAARRADVVDGYHGNLVADPYRWTEDPESEETRSFVAAQNAISIPYLEELPEVAELREAMTRMWRVARTGRAERRSGVTVWSHNDGSTDQPRFFVHQGDDERILLDPNELSDDGATAVVESALSPDGSHWAYSVADGGSDWQVIRVMSTSDRRGLDDLIEHVKFTSIAWWGNGFFYARFPAQPTGSTDPSRDQSVWYHRLGTSQSDDVEWFANPIDPDLGYDPAVTHDGRYLVLEEWNGTARENGLLIRALPSPDEEPVDDWRRVVEPGVAVHEVVDAVEGALVVLTDLHAPNKRVTRLDIDDGTYEDIVPESEHTIDLVATTGGRLAVVRLDDASHRVDLYETDGTFVERVDVPWPGTVTSLSSAFGEPDLFVSFESFLHPPSVMQWSEQGSAPFAGAAPPLDPDRVIIERLRAISTDGAAVPMFVVRLASTVLPGPVELYGYGGFTVNITPMFNPAWLAYLEAGGIVAVANLRGGTEFGEEWHRQGMLGSKQQVFDDFTACAEHLVTSGMGAPGSVGIRGRSNGGLLAAACMVQRPDLFGAVVSQVPVTDMLRYQHFTAGRYWTVEYGDAADPDAFRWLYAYSPYHRVSGVRNPPPLLITTAEFDDRVVPMHSLKLAAAAQHAVGGSSEQPLLLRVDTRSGHGLGKPVSKLIDESVHVSGFMLHHLRRNLPTEGIL